MSSLLLSIALIVLLICVGGVGYYLYKTSRTLRQKEEVDARAKEYRENYKLLDNAIASSVSMINQRMVSLLKASGGLTQRDKEEAFEECKKQVQLMLSPSILQDLEKSSSHTDELINARIEYHVRKQKK